MRTVTGTLETAQTAASRVPYIHLLFTSQDGTTTYDYSGSTSRLLKIYHVESPYSGYATVTLNNNDLAVPDLRSYWTEIGYGDVTSGGNEYEATPRLKVKKQTTMSSEGTLLTVLYLEDCWGDMEEFNLAYGTAPEFYRLFGRDTTPLDIMGEIITDAGFTLNAPAAKDSIIDTFLPYFEINADNDSGSSLVYEDAKAVLYRLIMMTLSYLKPMPGKEFDIAYPQNDDEADLEITTAGFYEYHKVENELLPNVIVVYCNQDEDGGWTGLVTGRAQDDAAIDRNGGKQVYAYYYAPTIETQVDADARAAAILSRIRAEISSIGVVIPHDCRLELYDNITITDTRGT